MKAASLRDLLARVTGEYRAKRSIFEIGETVMKQAFELEARSPGFELLGATVSLPVGPAAGPHTQIAPNIVAAYLAGARVFELKTVQENDRLDIEKPCIDALDEGYNVEWSTELSLEDARAEYLRAWAAIHLLEALFSRGAKGRFIFNLSVGYTLEGIKGRRVDEFIEGMRAPEGSAVWREVTEELRAAAASAELARAFGAEAARRAQEVAERLPASPIHSVTLSTMHGCPPAEIERIGGYLITEKGLSTFVKLNPTLLGYDHVRAILDETGWGAIRIEPPVFEKDLQFSDALALLASLGDAARHAGVGFGIKLSNTLAAVNVKNRLPGKEMYLSGRALFPITTELAAELAAALPGPLPFSFCAGVSEHNAADCIAAGLGPLTAATELLKPGGYARLLAMAEAAVEALEAGAPRRPDAGALVALARSALERSDCRGDWKQGTTAIAKGLPLFDCFAAPCVEACPVNQKAPAYIRTLAAGRASEALGIVLADNPLPTVTGLLCDHACMTACARVDYEGPVAIRAVKLACAQGAEIPPERPPALEGKGKAAIFGAGPAGLACAHYLALAGYPVVLFDPAASAGGVVANVIPRFRISPEQIAHDIERIRALGAEFRFGSSGVEALEELRAQGFTSFVIASGAPVSRAMRLAGTGVRTVDALEFLAQCGRDPDGYAAATEVLVAGGGNTAMDAARVAARLPGRPRVRLLYRRTRAEMPADREELEAALAEGVELCELLLPVRLEPGLVAAEVMQLGEPDDSGRRSPLPSGRREIYPCDLLVTAVGESPDRRLLEGVGIVVAEDGRPAFDPATLETALPGVYVAGDAARGPSSIIRSEADGRTAARAILAAAGIAPQRSVAAESAAGAPAGVAPRPLAAILADRGRLLASKSAVESDFVAREAERCLSCDVVCLRCVEVCPNRANVALAVHGGGRFSQGLQILHLDDLCNECGNCGFFCPYEGEPYRGKPTLFSSEKNLQESRNDGFAFVDSAGGREIVLRVRGATMRVPAGAAGGNGAAADLASLLAFARTVLAEHPYLIPGEAHDPL